MIISNRYIRSLLHYSLLLVLLLFTELLYSHNPLINSFPFNSIDRFRNLDKCGFDEVLAKQQFETLGDHWGYGYDSLLTDLQRWEQNAYLTTDSLGANLQNRALWQLAIRIYSYQLETPSGNHARPPTIIK